VGRRAPPLHRKPFSERTYGAAQLEPEGVAEFHQTTETGIAAGVANLATPGSAAESLANGEKVAGIALNQ